MIKTVIFDYNGTLVDDTEKMAVLFSRALEKTGVKPITPADFRDKFALPVPKLMENFEIPTKKQEIAIQNFLQEWLNYKNDTPLFDDTKEILEFLKEKGIDAIILTSYLPDPLEKELNENRIKNYFSQTICNGHKINELNKIIKERDLLPKEVLCVGDVEYDIETGKQVGAKTAGFTGGYISEDRLKKANPDYLVDSLSEIKEIIEKEG